MTNTWEFLTQQIDQEAQKFIFLKLCSWYEELSHRTSYNLVIRTQLAPSWTWSTYAKWVSPPGNQIDHLWGLMAFTSYSRPTYITIPCNPIRSKMPWACLEFPSHDDCGWLGAHSFWSWTYWHLRAKMCPIHAPSTRQFPYHPRGGGSHNGLVVICDRASHL